MLATVPGLNITSTSIFLVRFPIHTKGKGMRVACVAVSHFVVFCLTKAAIWLSIYSEYLPLCTCDLVHLFLLLQEVKHQFCLFFCLCQMTIWNFTNSLMHWFMKKLSNMKNPGLIPGIRLSFLQKLFTSIWKMYLKQNNYRILVEQHLSPSCHHIFFTAIHYPSQIYSTDQVRERKTVPSPSTPIHACSGKSSQKILGISHPGT